MPAQYISRTYRDLWTAVKILDHMETATGSKDERLALRLSILTQLFFALEAYVNHLGSKIAPDVWDNERNNFNGRTEIAGRRYPGPIGKIEYLQLLCSVSDAVLAGDMEAIKELKKFRDLMAHGKTEEETLSHSCPSTETPELVTPVVWQYINSDLMERAFPAIETLMTTMHAAAVEAFPDSGLEPSPFVSSFIQITDVV